MRALNRLLSSALFSLAFVLQFLYETSRQTIMSCGIRFFSGCLSLERNFLKSELAAFSDVARETLDPHDSLAGNR